MTALSPQAYGFLLGLSLQVQEVGGILDIRWVGGHLSIAFPDKLGIDEDFSYCIASDGTQQLSIAVGLGYVFC